MRLGERAVDSYLLSFRGGEHGLTTIAYYFWCLRGPEGVTLVDTGGAPDEAQKRGLQGVQTQEEQLAKMGIDPQGVRRVILTHLHWDHFGRWELFPQATFYLQKREFEFFTSPLSRHEVIRQFCSNVSMIADLQKQGRVKLVAGEEVILPGLAVSWVGGHTPGSQVVAVETRRGKMVLCGDLHYLYAHIAEDMPSLIQLDIPECLAAFASVKELAASRELILPGHDPLLTSLYPEPGGGIARVA